MGETYIYEVSSRFIIEHINVNKLIKFVRGFHLNKIFAMLVFVLLFAGIANAAMVRMPDTIIMEEAPKEIVVSVDNETAVKQPLDVEFFVPVRYEVYDKPGWVYPNERVKFTVRLIPRADLTGLVYESKAVFKLGVLEEEKDIKLEFRKANRCYVEAEVRELETANSEDGASYEIRLVNKGIEAQEVKMLSVTGIPSDWGYEFDNEEITVVPGISSIAKVKLIPNSRFEGTGEVLFRCAGQEKASGEFALTHKIGGDVGEENDLNNLIVIGLGILDFKAIDFSMEMPTGTELVIDIVLAMVVILLIVAIVLKVKGVKK